MAQTFGGRWTAEKLEILGEYLDRYTTALKNQSFDLIYVDAFAGEGQWRPNSGYEVDDYEDYRAIVDGSARIALKVQDKPFDQLVFIEKDPIRCDSLRALRNEFPYRGIIARNDDANHALAVFCDDLESRNARAVVFLDPYATQVRWETVERLARTKKADCWILFPLAAVARIMPTAEEPSPQLQARLDVIFGGREHWESIYHDAPQRSLFGEQSQQRDAGSDAIAGLYRKRLSVFEKVAPTSLTLRNSRNAPLFELFFAASNPRGAPIAINIANHIMERWGTSRE